MNKLTPEQLKEIIGSGDFDKLLESIESEHLDCKSGIYLLNTNQNKFEFAKDITSFANASGGYILIGPQTERSEVHSSDVIKSVSLLTVEQLDISKYFDIVKEWIYPEIVGLEIYWKESLKESKKGLFIIKIPKQTENIKPFLMTRTVESDKISNIFFGYAERKRDNSQPLDVRTIQNILKNGLNYFQFLSERLGKIEQIIEQGAQVAPPPEFTPPIKDRVQDCINVNENNQRRIIALCAYPNQPNNLKTIFERKAGGLLNKLENPPQLRYAGWDLATLDRAKIFEGKFIQLCNGDRITIRLYRDGVFIFCGGPDFWAWPDETSLKLNCLGLVEGIYHFTDFCKEIVSDFTQEQANISLQFHVANLHMNGEKTYLRAGPLESIQYQHVGQRHEAPRDMYISPAYTYNFSAMDTREIAYNFINEFYLWFGISNVGGDIPYIMYENGIAKVDIEAIRRKR